MIFNNIDFNKYVKVEEVRRPLLSSISNIFVKIPGRDGDKFIRNELENISLEIDIRLIEKNKEEVRNKVRVLAGELYTKEPKRLITNETGKYDVAILDGRIDIEKFLYTGFTTLKFIAEPLSHGETKALDIANSPTIYNLGTYPTTGTIKISLENPVDHLKITLEDTGEYIYLKHDFISGDVITIDLEEEMAYKNGYSIMADCYLESDFFDIPIGEFKISVSSGIATLEFTERWL